MCHVGDHGSTDGYHNFNGIIHIMKTAAFHILRVGMAITFLWIGVLIFREPRAWGGLLQPWAAGLLPVPLGQAMLATAVLDVLIGLFLLVDIFTFIASAIGLLHLLVVLTVVGINEITVRDIGLAAAMLALVFYSWPEQIKIENLFQKQKAELQK